MKTWILIAALCTSPAALAAKKAPPPAPAQKTGPDIVDTLMAAGNFRTLATALQAAGMIDPLKEPGPFTLLAPTDDAFARLPPGAVDDLIKDPPRLTALLKNHLLKGSLDASALRKQKTVRTLGNTPLKVEGGEALHIGEATVTKADVACKNGVLHAIDAVLLPPEPKRKLR